MAKRLEREFGRFDVDALDSQEYQAMPREHRNHAYLYLLMLTGWSRKRRTDGVLPRNIAADIARRMGQRSSTLLPVLAAVGMAILTPELVTLTKYVKWQETRAEIEKHQQDARERQSRHRSVTPMSQPHVTRDTRPLSRVSHVTEKEIEKEKEIVNASARDKALRVDAVKDKDDPGLELAVLMEPLLGHALSAVDIQNCGAALQQFEYLTGLEHFVKRAAEHNTVCQVKSWPKPRTIEGYFDSWRRENEYMADKGALKPRTRAGVNVGLAKLNLANLVHVKEAK